MNPVLYLKAGGRLCPVGGGMESLKLEISPSLRQTRDLDGGVITAAAGFSPGAAVVCQVRRGDGVFEWLQKVLDAPLRPGCLETEAVYVRPWESDGVSCPAVKDRVFVEPVAFEGRYGDWGIRCRLHFAGERRVGRFSEGRFA